MYDTRENRIKKSYRYMVWNALVELSFYIQFNSIAEYLIELNTID